MKISIAQADPLKQNVDLLVLFATEEELAAKKLPLPFGELDKLLDGHLATGMTHEKFKGKAESTFELQTLGLAPAKRVAVIGLGAAGRIDEEGLRQAAGRTAKLIRRVSARKVALAVPGASANVTPIAEGLLLGSYRFERYLSEQKAPFEPEVLLVADSAGAGVRKAAEGAQHLAESVALARDLVNTPAGDLTPSHLADAARSLAKKEGLSIEVLDRPQIEKLKMGMFLGVAQGSPEPPKLIHLWHAGRGRKLGSTRKGGTGGLAFIGKAITFDSGGLSLKTNEGMLDMKCDMAGAAAVLGAMREVARLDPPFPVHAYMGACENMPSGHAYKLGDVLRARSGRTVEINNTDAEGRLVLGDMLFYANERKPDALVDVATLTGACMVALGPWTAGAFGADEGFTTEVLAAARAAGEDVWRMPLVPWLRDGLKSDIADTRNTAERYGGAITAAHFLHEFVGKTPWVHLDVAGPAFSSKERGYIPKGGTGFAVRTLAALVERRMSGGSAKS